MHSSNADTTWSFATYAGRQYSGSDSSTSLQFGLVSAGGNSALKTEVVEAFVCTVWRRMWCNFRADDRQHSDAGTRDWAAVARTDLDALVRPHCMVRSTALMSCYYYECWMYRWDKSIRLKHGSGCSIDRNTKTLVKSGIMTPIPYLTPFFQTHDLGRGR